MKKEILQNFKSKRFKIGILIVLVLSLGFYIVNLEVSIGEAKKAIKKTKRQVSQREDIINRIKSKNQVLNEQIGELEQKQKKNKNEIESLREERKNQRNKIKKLKKQNSNLKDENRELQHKVALKLKRKQRERKESNATEMNNTKVVADVSRTEPTNPDKIIYVESTAYTAYCPGCSGITATGINLKSNPDAKVIAVDPDVIPLGSKVWVEGYGYAIAGDTGGAIDGNRIDVFIADRGEALDWGRKTVKVKILNGG